MTDPPAARPGVAGRQAHHGRTSLRPLLGALSLLLLGACVRPRTTPLEELASCLQGSFDSADQARLDPGNFQDIRLQVVRIWPERQDGIWLYLEQAEATSQDRPYRQRVWHLTALPDGRFLSTNATFQDPLRLAGAWAQPGRFAALGPEHLEARKGCEVLLKAAGKGIFSGGTAATACESSLRGATYATTEVALTPRTLTSWDRGFDAQGRQVWGALTGPYVFQKRRDAQ